MCLLSQDSTWWKRSVWLRALTRLWRAWQPSLLSSTHSPPTLCTETSNWHRAPSEIISFTAFNSPSFLSFACIYIHSDIQTCCSTCREMYILEYWKNTAADKASIPPLCCLLTSHVSASLNRVARDVKMEELYFTQLNILAHLQNGSYSWHTASQLHVEIIKKQFIRITHLITAAPILIIDLLWYLGGTECDQNNTVDN